AIQPYEHIGAVAAVEDVVAGAARDRIVAVPAAHKIVACASNDDVVASIAGQIVDPGGSVDLVRKRRASVHQDAGVAGIVREEVETHATRLPASASVVLVDQRLHQAGCRIEEPALLEGSRSQVVLDDRKTGCTDTKFDLHLLFAV